jgi:Ca2+-binding RTX toxin-like protein
MTNQDFINKGVPSSLFLPGTKYWKKKRTFSARGGIWNFDSVTTNKKGSSILLDASEDSILGGAGLNFGASRVQMSAGNDSIRAVARSGVRLSQIGFEIQGERDTYFSPTPGSVVMGNGNNTIEIGGENNNWEVGIRVGIKALLQGGSGKDLIRTSGLSQGISVSGTIELGEGNDTVESTSLGGDSSLHIDNTGRIDTGGGDDILIGRGGSRSIYINGTLVMGNGNDLITGDSLHVNSSTGALVDMGAGDDIISAPLDSANGARFDFGTGNDKLTVRPGNYTISGTANSGTVLSGGGIIDVVVDGLEFLVSSASGREYAYAPGLITVV